MLDLCCTHKWNAEMFILPLRLSRWMKKKYVKDFVFSSKGSGRELEG